MSITNEFELLKHTKYDLNVPFLEYKDDNEIYNKKYLHDCIKGSNISNRGNITHFYFWYYRKDNRYNIELVNKSFQYLIFPKFDYKMEKFFQKEDLIELELVYVNGNSSIFTNYQAVNIFRKLTNEFPSDSWEETMGKI